MKTKVIVITGPTAVGKTALGIDLAQVFNGEIISGDSQQVYRKLDIGTAKATLQEQAQVPHHLIDVRNPDESYSAYDFVQEARAAIEDIQARGKLPIIVGGTGLYLQSLLEGYHLGGEVDQEAVMDYRKELESLSDEAIFSLMLQLTDKPEQPNRRRIIRALELQKFGKHLKNQASPYASYIITLNDDRQKLYERINQRVDSMVKSGLLDEASWLYKTYPKSQAARAIGYKELFPFFAGEVTLPEAIDKIKQHTRRFAKRQLTWFRNRMKTHFYDISEPNVKQKITEEINNFLAKES